MFCIVYMALQVNLQDIISSNELISTTKNIYSTIKEEYLLINQTLTFMIHIVL